MRCTLAIPIAMAAIAVALPQGPGGSRAVLGWCDSSIRGCAFGSLYDCLNRGDHNFTYCTTKCRCENKYEPKSYPGYKPPNPNKRPTLPPSEQLPLDKSEDKTGDLSVNPGQDEYTEVSYNEGDGTDTSGGVFSSDGFTTALNGGETTTETPSDVFETPTITTAPTEEEQATTPEDNNNYIDDTLTALTEDTQQQQQPTDDNTYYEDSITASADTNQETTGADNFVTATTEGTQTSDDNSYDYSLTASSDTPPSDSDTDTAYLGGEDDSGTEFTA